MVLIMAYMYVPLLTKILFVRGGQVRYKPIATIKYIFLRSKPRSFFKKRIYTGKIKNKYYSGTKNYKQRKQNAVTKFTQCTTFTHVVNFEFLLDCTDNKLNDCSCAKTLID